MLKIKKYFLEIGKIIHVYPATSSMPHYLPKWESPVQEIILSELGRALTSSLHLTFLKKLHKG